MGRYKPKYCEYCGRILYSYNDEGFARHQIRCCVKEGKIYNNPAKNDNFIDRQDSVNRRKRAQERQDAYDHQPIQRVSAEEYAQIYARRYREE